MTNPANNRSAALMMAVYTFLLALGAVLPLAASYSDGIENRNTESHIQGGAYQRRVEVGANPSDQVGIELPEQAVRIEESMLSTDAERAEHVSHARAAIEFGASRGS